MNSKQRRTQRRIMKRIIRNYKRGERGDWVYYHGSNNIKYDVIISDDWISVYLHSPSFFKENLVTSFSIKFPEATINNMSFLKPYKNSGLSEYPAYKLIGTDYLLIPGSYPGVLISWVEEGRWNDGSYRLSNISFDEVFSAMTKAQQAEAIWYLDILLGE